MPIAELCLRFAFLSVAAGVPSCPLIVVSQCVANGLGSAVGSLAEALLLRSLLSRSDLLSQQRSHRVGLVN